MAEESIIRIIVEGSGGKLDGVKPTNNSPMGPITSILSGSGAVLGSIPNFNKEFLPHELTIDWKYPITNTLAAMSLLEPSQSTLAMRGSILIGNLASQHISNDIIQQHQLGMKTRVMLPQDRINELAEKLKVLQGVKAAAPRPLLTTVFDVAPFAVPTDFPSPDKFSLYTSKPTSGNTLIDRISKGEALEGGMTGGFRGGFNLFRGVGPTSSASSTGGLVREGYQQGKHVNQLLKTVTTPSVGSSMRLLRAGGLAGGGLALALGLSAYIDNARQDAVLTAAAEGRDATGGEVLRSVHDKITSHINGVGSFFQKAIAGVASAPGKLVGNFGVGWAALSGDGSAARDANAYAEDVDEYWSEKIGLKSTRMKRWEANHKFNEARDHAKWLARDQADLAIRRNAENFAQDYIGLGIATHAELLTLYESEMTTRIREKYNKQFLDEFDKTHNRTTFVRAALGSQGD